MSPPADPAGAGRPSALVLVAGTGTEVGKTWVAAAVARVARAAGATVAARKPAQSFDPSQDEPTDAEVLGAATSTPPEQVCPPDRWYEVPMAPPMAARALDRPVPRLDDLVDALDWPDGTALGLVETAGGVLAPQAADGHAVDLAARLAVDGVLLVADAGLGTIHGTRSAVAALAELEVPVVLVLNRFDGRSDLHRRNLAWLRDEDGLDPCTHHEQAWERLRGLVERP